MDMHMLADCKTKLKSFRVKELKDVLGQLGVPNQGRRKQDLLERVVNILYPVEALEIHGSVDNNLTGKQVAKIIDHVHRKMQGTNTTGSTSGDLDISSRTSKQVRCPCGGSLRSELMIQCSDPECQVWQHINCVISPEESIKGVDFRPHFYCERCRISRSDPFLMTVAQPLPPVKLIVSRIPIDSSSPRQHVEAEFEITTEHARLLEDTDCEAQVWCVLLKDSVPFRMHWPLYADLRINGTPLETASRPLFQKLGVNGRDDGSPISLNILKGINKMYMGIIDARSFCLGVRIVRRRTIQQVIDLIPSEQEGEPFSESLARVCRCIGGGTDTTKEDGDIDLEVTVDCVTVNLRCPISGSRIKTASRFRPCMHLRCFDLHTFIQLNQKSKKWQCPICLKNFSFKDIIIDPFFNGITKMMRDYEDDITEIDVKPDGSWRVKNGLCFVNHQQWHLPDGSVRINANMVNVGRHKNPTSEKRMKSNMQTQASRNQLEECAEPSASFGDPDVIVISDSDEERDNQGAGTSSSLAPLRPSTHAEASSDQTSNAKRSNGPPHRPQSMKRLWVPRK